MCSGTLPFRGETSAAICDSILHATPAPLSSANPRVPDDLNQVVRRALEKLPDKRFASAAEMRAKFESIRQQRLIESSGSLQITRVVCISRDQRPKSFASCTDLNLFNIDFLMKSGRAVMFPVYKGTYERMTHPTKSGSNEERDLENSAGRGSAQLRVPHQDSGTHDQWPLRFWNSSRNLPTALLPSSWDSSCRQASSPVRIRTGIPLTPWFKETLDCWTTILAV
jgi:hypothetical protein